MVAASLQIGELAAVGTAILWTLSAVCWTAAGHRVGALVVSFVRLLVTCVLLSVFGLAVHGQPLPVQVEAEGWGLLGLSGFLGFFLSDLFLFKAFLLMGPRLSLLLYSLTPPLTALFAWPLVGEPLAARGWLGMVVTLSGVAWVVAERSPQAVKVHARYPWRGVLFAILAAHWQALGAVLAQLGVGDSDPAAATFVRVLGGLVGLIPLVTIWNRWPAVFAATKDARAMSIIAAGSVVGPFLGVTLFLVALQHCHAGVVTTITATMPILILPFSVLLHGEHVSLRAFGGAVLSVVGVGVLVW